jgi:hypothetical protein
MTTGARTGTVIEPKQKLPSVAWNQSGYCSQRKKKPLVKEFRATKKVWLRKQRALHKKSLSRALAGKFGGIT